MKVASLKFSTEKEPPFYDVKVDDEGNVSYYNKKGELHRLDGPAVEKTDGTKEWWVNGKKHRLDGPAVETTDGDKEWWVNGMRHRLDGPAVENANGTREWWVNGREHRLDGPAIEWADGDKEWYVNGNRHRLDGPAIINTDGTKEWWIKGDLLGSTKGRFSDKKFEQWRAKHVREDGSIVNNVGDVVYYDEKTQLHRLNGPAIEWADGKRKAWYVNGQLHRLDGPAVDFGDDYKAWYVKGKLIGTSKEGFTQKKFELWKKEHGL